MRDVSVDRSGTSRARIVIGLAVTALGAVFLGMGLFGDSGLALVGLGAAVVFLGVAVLGPVMAGPLSGAIGIPIRKIKGVTGSLATENAMRNPKRTSATAAALMIGVGLVGLITIFAASARFTGASGRKVPVRFPELSRSPSMMPSFWAAVIALACT